MLNLEIPNTDNGIVWTRKKFEQWIRNNVLSKGNSTLVKLAQRFNLMGEYAYVVPSIVLIHYILDRLIKENKGPESIKIEGELMGICSSRAANSEVKQFKIKGIDSPRQEITEFMESFTEKLAHFITHEYACMPAEGEGIDLDKLQDLLGRRGTPQYILPMPPPPIHPVAKEARDPSKTTRTKRVVDIQDIENVKADIGAISERLAKQEFTSSAHERRIVFLEELIKEKR